MSKTPTTTTGSQQEAGNPIDAAGGAAIDPTSNVRELVEAAIKRQDDLLAGTEKYFDARLSHKAEIITLRALYEEKLAKHEASRIDAVLESHLHRVEQVARIREIYADKLRTAEASRINAIREVDVSSVATANDRAQQQAVVLANQVATSAETLRSLVASTNASNAATLTQITTQLTDRITAVDKQNSDRITNLERTSYEGKGKEAVSDPAMALMVAEFREMRKDMSTNSGRGAGMEKMWGWVAAGITLIISLLGAFGIVLSMRGR